MTPPWSRVNPSAQAGSRSVLVYLALERSEGFRQGLFAQGRLEVGRSGALALPLSAVRVDKPEPYVQMVVDGRSRASAGADRLACADWTARPSSRLQGLEPGAQVVIGSVGAAARRHGGSLPRGRSSRRARGHVVHPRQPENPVFATMVMLALVVLGLFSFQRRRSTSFRTSTFRWWW